MQCFFIDRGWEAAPTMISVGGIPQSRRKREVSFFEINAALGLVPNINKK